MSEKIIIVDSKDKRIGLKERDEVYQKNYIHRSVHLILFNFKNEMLIQKRKRNKHWFPNLFTFAVSGTVDNETYKHCIEHEIREELGISIKVKKVYKFSLFHKTERAFHMVYVGYSNKKIHFDKSETQFVKWISLDKLKKDIKMNPRKYTPPFIKGMGLFFKNSKKYI